MLRIALRTRRLPAAIAVLALGLLGGVSVAAALTGPRPEPGKPQLVRQPGAQPVGVEANDNRPAYPGAPRQSPSPEVSGETTRVHVVRDGKVYTIEVPVTYEESVDASGRKFTKRIMHGDKIDQSQLPPLPECTELVQVGCLSAEDRQRLGAPPR